MSVPNDSRLKQYNRIETSQSVTGFIFRDRQGWNQREKDTPQPTVWFWFGRFYNIIISKLLLPEGKCPRQRRNKLRFSLQNSPFVFFSSHHHTISILVEPTTDD